MIQADARRFLLIKSALICLNLHNLRETKKESHKFTKLIREFVAKKN